METETHKPLGALLPGIVDQSITATASCGPLTKPSDVLDLDSLTGRIDDATLGVLAQIADAPLPAPERADDDHFAKCLRSMAILPYRADDEIGGKLRHRLYAAKLQGYSNEALSFLVSKALDQCQWFPTIAECLAILRTWPNRDVADSRRRRADHLIGWEWQKRMDEAMEALAKRTMPQGEIDALPAKWKRIAADKGYLWVWPDGRFTTRVDVLSLPEDQREAERERNKAMFAKWEAIEAQRGPASE